MSDPTRRSRLLAVKLEALARDNDGPRGGVPGDFGSGAAFIAGTEAWVLLDTDPSRGLGPAVAWALRRDATRLHVLADAATGLLARRAEAFRMPITVSCIQDRSLLPAIAEPLPVPPPLDPRHEALRADIVAGGAMPVVEHGVLAGEVFGLEVCRVVTDPVSGEPRLEVGVGAHDREAFQLLHGDRPTVEALASVVASVAALRDPMAPGHPLKRLGQERALRAHLIAEPSLIGAIEVVVAQPPFPRSNLKDPTPCVAVATMARGSVTVVCSTGVDLDVVPYACDARRATGVVDCVVVVPTRDLLPVQHAINESLLHPIELVALDVLGRNAP